MTSPGGPEGSARARLDGALAESPAGPFTPPRPGSPAPATRRPAAPTPRLAVPSSPTVWGLDLTALHDSFWASRGVRVVRPVGEPPAHGNGNGKAHGNGRPGQRQLFLLAEPAALVIFDPAGQPPLWGKAFGDSRVPGPPPGSVSRALSRVGPDLLYVRVQEPRPRADHERVVTDGAGQFVRFERLYDRPRPHTAPAALTSDPVLAHAWASAPDAISAWRMIRRLTPRYRRGILRARGMVYAATAADRGRFVHDLLCLWERPDVVVARARPLPPPAAQGKSQADCAGAGVWCDAKARVDSSARLIGPVWVGAGRKADAGELIIGPVVLWDDPAARPAPPADVPPGASWLRDLGGLRPLPGLAPPPPVPPARGRAAAGYLPGKRAFDLLFSVLLILLTIPIYPLLMLAIMLEDGFPIFFAHRREGLGGREFPCLKFRSMRRNAEKIKKELVAKNQADGPQFFMENDPRLTRVGRFIRKWRLDELPQFFNVLAGHMSVVGPRPSPFSENQFCPPWREARLSVKPGITGLWQVNRTRRSGNDFQEWIRYDLEYVKHASWSLDLKIIATTVLHMIHEKKE